VFASFGKIVAGVITSVLAQLSQSHAPWLSHLDRSELPSKCLDLPNHETALTPLTWCLTPGVHFSDLVDHYIDDILPDGFKAQVVCHSKLAAVRYQKAIWEALAERLAREKTEVAARRESDSAHRVPEGGGGRVGGPYQRARHHNYGSTGS
jgi:hypothetical protein